MSDAIAAGAAMARSARRSAKTSLKPSAGVAGFAERSSNVSLVMAAQRRYGLSAKMKKGTMLGPPSVQGTLELASSKRKIAAGSAVMRDKTKNVAVLRAKNCI